MRHLKKANSAEKVFKGFRAYHNFVRPHMALENLGAGVVIWTVDVCVRTKRPTHTQERRRFKSRRTRQETPPPTSLRDSRRPIQPK
jgi:hypothetical protein